METHWLEAPAAKGGTRTLLNAKQITHVEASGDDQARVYFTSGEDVLLAVSVSALVNALGGAAKPVK
jgi:hypothetical protein